MSHHLRSENHSLRQQLEALLREARQNEDKMRRFDQLQRQLIGADSLPELIGLLLSEYKQAFGVEFVTLALLDREYEVARILECGKGRDVIGEGLTLHQAIDPLMTMYPDVGIPYLGPFEPSSHQSLFNAQEGEITSVALLPLTRHGALIGSLNFGSASPSRYVAGCGTDFLERLSEVIAICLESALSQERLKLVGLTDALTGVQNRRYFEHRCQAEIGQARRYKHSLACMFLDIDKFKYINDTYGHQKGDDVLKRVAEVIKSQLREGDTIARYGGEEFVVLLPQADTNHACQIAERIRNSVAEAELYADSGAEIRLTISIGLAMLPIENGTPENSQLAEQLVAAADKALYQAKHGGRNQVICEGCPSIDAGRPSRSTVMAGRLSRVSRNALNGLKRLALDQR